MKRNFEKDIHILNQLMGYFKNAGAAEIDSKMQLLDNRTAITVKAAVSGIEEKNLESLCRQLEMPRQPEVEQNYWNIGLSGNLGDELGLVGMMTDTSSISYANEILTIKVERQNHSY